MSFTFWLLGQPFRQQSPNFLVPQIGFVEDNFFMDWGGGWFQDDSSAWHLLCTLFLLLHRLHLRSSGIRWGAAGGWEPLPLETQCHSEEARILVPVLGIFLEHFWKGCCESAPLGQNMPPPRGSPTTQGEPHHSSGVRGCWEHLEGMERRGWGQQGSAARNWAREWGRALGFQRRDLGAC